MSPHLPVQAQRGLLAKAKLEQGKERVRERDECTQHCEGKGRSSLMTDRHGSRPAVPQADSGSQAKRARLVPVRNSTVCLDARVSRAKQEPHCVASAAQTNKLQGGFAIQVPTGTGKPWTGPLFPLWLSSAVVDFLSPKTCFIAHDCYEYRLPVPGHPGIFSITWIGLGPLLLI